MRLPRNTRAFIVFHNTTIVGASLSEGKKLTIRVIAGGGFLVNVGMNSVLIVSSRCWKWLLRFGRMRNK